MGFVDIHEGHIAYHRALFIQSRKCPTFVYEECHLRPLTTHARLSPPKRPLQLHRGHSLVTLTTTANALPPLQPRLEVPLMRCLGADAADR